MRTSFDLNTLRSTIHTRLQQPQSVQWVVYACCVLLGLVIVWNGYRIVTVPQQLNAMLPVSESEVAPLEKPPTVSANQLKKITLFGKYAVPAAFAPETRLKVVLRGIFATDSPDTGSAVVAASEGNDPGKTYVVGNTITGGAKIIGIYPDYVLLDNHGQHEKLRLPQQGLPDQ